MGSVAVNADWLIKKYGSMLSMSSMHFAPMSKQVRILSYSLGSSLQLIRPVQTDTASPALRGDPWCGLCNPQTMLARALSTDRQGALKELKDRALSVSRPTP